MKALSAPPRGLLKDEVCDFLFQENRSSTTIITHSDTQDPRLQRGGANPKQDVQVLLAQALTMFPRRIADALQEAEYFALPCLIDGIGVRFVLPTTTSNALFI
jgi:hypothetical protein